MLIVCGSPTEENNDGKNINSDNITPTAYTTTVSGKITTPAGKPIVKYETNMTTGLVVAVPYAEDALVWASTDPATKVNPSPDGSYTLSVTHKGTFTLTANYPTDINRVYKTSDPQTVNTTESTHTQNIALNYRYRTTLSGKVGVKNTTTLLDNVTVTLQVEGRDVATTLTNSSGEYSVTIDHDASFIAIFSRPDLPGSATNYVSSTHSAYTLNRTGVDGL